MGGRNAPCRPLVVVPLCVFLGGPPGVGEEPVAVRWEARFGGENPDWGRAVIETSDGDLVVAGTTHVADSPNAERAYLLRLGGTGDVIWEAGFGEPGGKAGVVGLSSVVEAPDGSLVVVGATREPCPPRCGLAPAQLYLAKVSGGGSLLWERSFGPAGGSGGRSIHALGEDAFLIGGGTRSSATLNDIYLVRTNAEGEVVWERSFGSDGNDMVHALREAADGTFLLVGETSSLGPSTDILLVSVDPEGEVVWETWLGGASRHEYGRDARPTSTGGWLIASTASLRGESDIYLVEVDASGKVVWERLLVTRQRETVAALAEAPGGAGWLVAGSVVADLDVESTYDGFVLNLDDQGRKIWEKRFGSEVNDSIAAMVLTRAGEPVVAGQTEHVQSSALSDDSDVYVARLQRPSPPEVFVRGDSNDDGEVNLSDAVHLLRFLFLGSASPRCLDAADANDDGELSITDAVFLLTFLFQGGSPPPPPHPGRGRDTTPDALRCP